MKALLIAALSLPLFCGNVFSADESPPPDKVKLEAVDDATGTAYQKAAKELAAAKNLLAAADKVDVAGFEAVEFISAQQCGGIHFTDGSFLILPQRKPYTSDGEEIDVEDDLFPDDEKPISLLAFVAEQRSKEALE